MTEFETFAQASGDTVQSLRYPGALLRRFFGEFLKVMRSMFNTEEEMGVEKSRRL